MFEGALHQPVFKELKIQNPSNKPISYNISIVGEDRNSFSAQPSSLSVSSQKYSAMGNLEQSQQFALTI